jgi:DNA segregation ATPase FtsK/SpoIIIE-like protein
MPGTIKTNLGVVVAFKMRNEAHSRILLERGDAANLRGKGHGLILAEGKLTEFQGFYIDDTMIKNLIGHTYIKMKPPEPEKIGVIPSENRKERKPAF